MENDERSKLAALYRHWWAAESINRHLKRSSMAPDETVAAISVWRLTAEHLNPQTSDPFELRTG